MLFMASNFLYFATNNQKERPSILMVIVVADLLIVILFNVSKNLQISPKLLGADTSVDIKLNFALFLNLVRE